MKITEIIEFFSSFGCAVTPVSDPKERHHNKRASTKRRADKVMIEVAIRAAIL